jgi:hypothetical protein
MRMEPPQSQKKVQRLTGCMAALSRFISRLGEKGMPFHKLLKKVDKFLFHKSSRSLGSTKKVPDHTTSAQATTPSYIRLAG